MPTASTLRAQIETALENRIPCALTPAPKTIQEITSTGIASMDHLLAGGGLPVGALAELIGAECSGRTTLALSFLTQVTNAGKVAAWIDASNTFSPESAAACGMDLKRLLWIQCGVERTGLAVSSEQEDFALPEIYFAPPALKKGLHGGGFGPHPRTEVKGMSDGVIDLLRSDVVPAQAADRQHRIHIEQNELEPHTSKSHARQAYSGRTAKSRTENVWTRIEQALRATDLLLQAGGFGAIVLDLGSLAPEHVSRIPLATWYRYGAAAERSRASVLLFTQYACAKSSASVALHLHTGSPLAQGNTFLAGLECHVEISRQRFGEASTNVVPFRKPPQSIRSATWQSKALWAGMR